MNNPLNGQPLSQKYQKILETRSRLPVWKARDGFLELIRDNPVTIVIGDTGSGKTTQLPQFAMLSEHSWNRNCSVVCTQPRRVAATSVAARVATEMDVRLGDEVGYCVRFDECASDRTRLRYLTDGMLIREAMKDHHLTDYDVVMLDESHERTASTDELLGFLKTFVLPHRNACAFPSNPNGAGPLDAQAGVKYACSPLPTAESSAAFRPLRLIVMSATLDVDKFRKFFPFAKTLCIPGRAYPVTLRYLPVPCEEYVEEAISTVLTIHSAVPTPTDDGTPAPPTDGDVLVFLTGEEEIEMTCRRLKGEVDDGTLLVLPLHGSLPAHEQARVFVPTPPGVRKVVVATNIAETSLTIDGVVFVVDCGFEKRMVYNPRNRQDSLLVTPISKAAATQRAGRAGRTRPGVCHRLYPAAEFDKLEAQTPPELLRTSLYSVVLTLVRMGIHNLARFDFPDPPTPKAMIRAFELLHSLGALSQTVELTPFGRQIVEFPLDPQMAAAVLISCRGATGDAAVEVAAQASKSRPLSATSVISGPPPADVVCSADVIGIAAVLSGPPIFSTGGKENARAATAARGNFEAPESDHLTLLNALNAYMDAGGGANTNPERVSRWCWDNWLHERHLRLAVNVRTQLAGICGRLGLPFEASPPGPHRSATIRRVLAGAFFTQVARHRTKREYKTMKENQLANLHASSAARGFCPPWVVYHEFIMSPHNVLRTVSAIELSWAVLAAPGWYAMADFPADDAKDIKGVLDTVSA